MTYDQLEAFLAVAREKSFTAASRKLHKSQPAVSKLIRNLEDEIGIELFDRREYRAALTPPGRLFFEAALPVVESTQALRTFGRELAGELEPIVRLAVEAVAPLGPIMEILRRAQERFPTVRLELTTERLAGAGDALREERADLAVATKLGVALAELEVAPYDRVRIVAVARSDHPLASRRSPIARARLREHAQIVLRDSSHGPDSPSLNVLEGGLRWSVTDVAAKREVILAGMGWGGLPHHVVADDLSSGRLVALEIPDFETDAMELFLLRRRDRVHGFVASTLWRDLESAGAGSRRTSPPSAPA